MPNNKMLIDATHPEETRVVVLRNNRVEEFDYESAARKQLRGNIYLAKVTRVEPSLQAAFVDYGGNRHGFLAFNEIHPDYYQIPMADRQALLDEEAAAEAREEAEADARAERLSRRRRPRGDRDGGNGDNGEDGPTEIISEPIGSYGDDAPEEAGMEAGGSHDDDGDEADEPISRAEATMDRGDSISEDAPGHDDEPEGHDEAEEAADREAEFDAGNGERDPGDLESPAESAAPRAGDLGEGEGVQEIPASPAEAVEQVGSEDALEELPSRPRRRPRSYKIQEVIKRRQIILVQVVKEERGTKGAALTTYLSLAGRYTVLMPNTARGGGISRKITNPQDRKRLKAIANELEVPEGMGLIIRTAGAARTGQEIRRDFEYLLRLWESVRDLTLLSTAPSLVYEEGNLIKRSIRDLFNKDVEEVIVAGNQAHEEARDFMSMLMPSHAKNVVKHTDPEPLFTKFGIERQLNAMFSPYVTLRSGGYLVINQTEALVAVDVNSGKATREFSIEETAYHTNLEAAEEIARQLKLRDLAGLIVIDFIDMEEKRNNRGVERRLKDALRFDRARIQLGRISHFGLMEMSRQRLRTGVLEGSTTQCPHCQGTGIIRSTESVALAVLRGLEDALMQGARTSLIATTTAQVALYILNNKRQFIIDMESRHGISVQVQASDKLQGANFTIEKGHAPAQASRRPERAAVNMDWGFEGDDGQDAGSEPEVRQIEDTYDDEAGDSGESQDRGDRGGSDGQDDQGGRRRRRRRGRRSGEGERQGGGDGNRNRLDNGNRDRDRQPRHNMAGGPSGGAYDEIALPGANQPDTGFAAADRNTGSFDADEGDDMEPSENGTAPGQGEGQGEQGERSKRRRRGRRGGRRGRDRNDRFERGAEGSETSESQDAAPQSHVTEEVVDDFGGAVMPDGLEPPMKLPAAKKSSGGREGRRPEGRREGRRNRGDRGPRREAEPVVTDDGNGRSEPAPEAAPAAPAETPPPAAVRRGNPESSEPKLERVVVGTGESGAASDTAPPEPKRGWWQRRLGD